MSLVRLDPERIPRHIAVIMDGNGRWATRRGLSRSEGHVYGYKSLKRFVNNAADLGVKAVTAYSFSSENWSRPDSEVGALMELFCYAARAELPYMQREGVRMLTSGRLHELPQRVQDQFREDCEATRHNSRIILNLAVNYGGRNEIVDAARRAARLAGDGRIGVDQIDEALLSSLMYSPELPDPDLVIRTAGEMRVSNFLLWEVAYSEFYVTKTLWPDFGKRHLAAAIASYQKRVRKFGAVADANAVGGQDE